jgi:biopolymer transport protein ExbB
VARFLAAPLKLKNPTPETFHLAIQAASDREYVDMRQGDKLLESVMAIAPLLGILGTALGLITTFTSLKNGQVNGTNIDVVVAGIGQALISSATGLTVAIIAFVFYRIFRTLRSRQIDFFSKVGSELELIYLQIWHQPDKSTSIKLSGNSFTEAE